jgi:type III pantothenate kinase
MNLIVDIGNTDTKLAIYDGREKISVKRINELDCDKIEKLLSELKINRAIISSVKEIPPFISDLLFANFKFVHILSDKSRLPFKVEYETPETLGTDRIAAAAGAFFNFPGDEILIIDAGTAITYEYLSSDIYKGGNISPGLMMRFKALNKFTGRLPLVSPGDNYTSPGLNTIDAIKAGVITGITYEINEYIRTFKKEHKNCKIVLTGGDSGFLKEKIKPQFTYMPDIVIDGLNYILEYNAT